jgi:uncharacterized protein (DUF433 family)
MFEASKLARALAIGLRRSQLRVNLPEFSEKNNISFCNVNCAQRKGADGDGTGIACAGCLAGDVIKNGLPMKFSRITVDPRQMDGIPCIRGIRIPVATVVGMVADGMTRGEILKAYPDLKAKDIEEALRYAAEAVRERELPLRSAS